MDASNVRAVVGVPAEYFTALGVDIKNRSPFEHTYVAELANDWDGYSGHIPKSSALAAQVLKEYGYATGAWGKWHNTPEPDISPAGPNSQATPIVVNGVMYLPSASGVVALPSL